jgi:hypothetical protein
MLASVSEPADGDTVFGERPQLLDQPILQLALPLSSEKRDDIARLSTICAGLRHLLSLVYPCATRRRSRVFQASSEAWTFWIAVSRVNGAIQAFGLLLDVGSGYRAKVRALANR